MLDSSWKLWLLYFDWHFHKFPVWFCCCSSIGIPKKIKHAVMNVCLSTLFLLVTFTFGINRTEVELPCQIIGICIHYLTLCTVFWITVTTKYVWENMASVCYWEIVKCYVNTSLPVRGLGSEQGSSSMSWGWGLKEGLWGLWWRE